MKTPMILDAKRREISWFTYDYEIFVRHSFQIRGYSDKIIKIILLLSDNNFHTYEEIGKYLKVNQTYLKKLIFRMKGLLKDNFNFISYNYGCILYDHIDIT